MSSILIFLGMPGSGKGTQAKRLSREFGYVHLSTGDLLRAEIENKTNLGNKIDSIIKDGHFVSDEIIVELVVSNMKEGFNYILDGFPRNLKQAEFLKEYIESDSNKKINEVIYLELSEDTVLKRLLGRRSCSCGKEFNIYFMPSGSDNFCDGCGEELIQRSDDNEQTIKNRLNVYFKETAPLIDFYDKQDLLEIIDSNSEIDKVYKTIKNKLGL